MNNREPLHRTGPLHVLVFGGRDHYGSRQERDAVREWLRAAKPALVIHGGANGADRWMSDVAAELGLETMAFEADWKKYGKRAGPIRNKAMAKFLSDKRAIGLMAPGGRGTDHMKDCCEHHQIPVLALYNVVKAHA